MIAFILLFCTWPRCPSGDRGHFHSGRSEISNFCGLLEENLIFLLEAASATSLLFSPVSILDRTSFVGDDPEMVTDFFLRLRPFLCGGG